MDQQNRNAELAENGEGFAEKIWKAIIWVMNIEHRVEENEKATSSLASHPGRATQPRAAIDVLKSNIAKLNATAADVRQESVLSLPTLISVQTSRGKTTEVDGFDIDAQRDYGKARLTLLRASQ